jgi:hypothetical protein
MSTYKDVNRLKHLLSVLSLKKRDAIKLKSELKNAKIILDNLIQKKNNYNNNGLVYDIILIQQNNLDILNAFEEFNKSTQEYQKISHLISHLTNQVSYINIEDQVNNVLSATTSTSGLI